jgi:thymidylate synthase
MNNLDKQYTDLLQDILDNGVTKQDRTGTGTISVFGRQIRHDMKDGFPLLTTKKMPWKSIVTELLWFLQGNTNIKYLVDNGCNIWNGDAYKNYQILTLKSLRIQENEIKEKGGWQHLCLEPNILSQEEFINKIKTDDEFAKKWGELGPIYGNQWRSWKQWHVKNYVGGNTQIDQIQNLINDLKTNPDSRRLMVNAWNVGELDQMVLPPCHYGFQVYTREMLVQERQKYDKHYDSLIGEYPEHHITLDKRGVPRRAISLMWNQRSVDTFLGLPFNIASYGLLLEIIAKEVNMVPDELIGNLGDVHLYSNHIEQAKEQIGRELTDEERIYWMRNNRRKIGLPVRDPNVEFSMDEFLRPYDVPKRTREPFPLPTLKFNPCPITGIDMEYQSIAQFEIENYQSHPTIKAPLSN